MPAQAREGARRELRRSAWWKRRIAAGVCHYCGRDVASGPSRRITWFADSCGRSVRGNMVPLQDCNRRSSRCCVGVDAYVQRLPRAEDD